MTEIERIQYQLRQRRVDRGITQYKMAEHLGRVQSYVSKYETGESHLTVEQYLRICEVLNVTPGKFLDHALVMEYL